MLEEIKKRYQELDLDSCSTAQDEGWIFDMVLGYIKPKKILEIGFYRGGSSFLMLSLSDANVTSVDPIFNITDSQLGRSI
jgi:predicted O-methyltransferase YrrM